MNIRLTTLALLLSLTASLFAAKDLRVVIDARANPEYIERTKDREYQTYRFAKGRYFAGDKFDGSLSKMEFENIAQSLLLALQKNNFYPTRDPENCDLLIMVSWGTTMLDIDWTETMGITDLGNNQPVEDQADVADNPAAQAAAEFTAEATQVDYYSNTSSYNKQQSIIQLGYDKALRGDISRRDRERYLEDLEEERYFMIVTAFDYPHYRKTEELKPVWSTRYSTRNLGTNFRTAMDVMNYAASSAFGVNLDTLQETKIDPDTRAGFGDLEIVEVIDEKQESKSDSK